jgi:hypothetical protein
MCSLILESPSYDRYIKEICLLDKNFFNSLQQIMMKIATISLRPGFLWSCGKTKELCIASLCKASIVLSISFYSFGQGPRSQREF